MEKKLEKFVETDISRIIQNQLKENQIVIIRGGPKSGKTVTAFYAAFQLRKTDGFRIHPATEANDLIHRSEKSRKEVFIFNDIFGKYGRKTSLVESWKQKRVDLTYILKHWINLKVIIVCRSQINMPDIFNERGGIKPYECSIELSTEERQLLLKEYLRGENEQPSDYDDFVKFSFFPALCERYSRSKQTLRKLSTEIIRKELKELKENDIFTFVTLGFLVIENNFIGNNIHEDLELDSPCGKRFKMACSEMKCYPLILPDIRETLKNLKGIYIIEIECGFTALNELMFTLISQNISEYFINIILNFSPNIMFRENIGLATLQSLQREHLFIVVPYELETEYFFQICERMVSSKNFGVLFKTVHSDIKLYRDKFVAYLKKNEKKGNMLTTLRDEKNASVLHVCAQTNFDDIALFFLSLTADLVTHKDVLDNLPIHEACLNGSYNVAKILLNKMLKYGSSINQLNAAGLSPIHIASFNGDDNLVKLLSKKVDINILSKSLETPLTIACKYKHTQVVDTLLANKADVNKRGFADTPLCQICEAGEKDIAIILLKYGAHVNRISKQDKSAPIHKAAYHGHSHIIKLLIKNRANIDKFDLEEHTALYIACKEGKLDVVKILLKGKADINGLNNFTSFHHLPQYIAYKNDHREVVDYLLQHVNNYTQSDEKYTFLFTACLIGDVKGVNFLLNHDNLIFNIDWKMPNGNTALCIACKRDDPIVVELLLSKKPNVNICVFNGETPLSFACRRGNTDITKLLIENNAQVDTVTKRGLSTLFISCLFEPDHDDSTSEILLGNSVSAEIGDKNGWTPLQLSCFNGTISVVQLLIKNGVNLNQTTTVHWLTPTEIAQNVRNQPKSNAKENKEDVDNFFHIKIPPLAIACWRNNTKLVDILLKNRKDQADVSQGVFGKKINVMMNKILEDCNNYVESCKSYKSDNEDFSNIHKLTAIQLACLNENVAVVETLIQHGARVNMFMPEGKITNIKNMKNEKLIRLLQKEKPKVPNKTSLIIACEKGNLNIVRSLLDYKANINQITRNGCTPLHAAILNADHTLIKKLLENSNCNTECHMKDVGTPLFLACSKNEKEIVKQLLDHGAFVHSTKGKTALKVAREKKYRDIVSLLSSKRSKFANKDRQTTAEKHKETQLFSSRKENTFYVPIKTRKIHKFLR